MSFDPTQLAVVISKIKNYGLFDNVERWVFEGPTLAMGHSGLMTVAKARMHAVRRMEGNNTPRGPVISDTLRADGGDEVPLLYRCWATPGNRMEQINVMQSSTSL
ncbi:hypothetical protein MTO96_037647 [Rhipicephalus appendiculatus]